MDAPLLRPVALPADARSATRQLADAVLQALAAPQLSLEALRSAAVRYGRAARDLAIAADEMTAGLTPLVSRCVAGMPAERRAQLVAHVEWWIAHGYHRAD